MANPTATPEAHAAPSTADRPDDARTWPDPPRLRMPTRELIANMRQMHVGPERIHRAGGPVCTRKLPGLPPVVWVATPSGARDVLGHTDGDMDKQGPIWSEIGRIGDNLFTLPDARWQPHRRMLQPTFTKGHVDGYGGHMAQIAAQRVASWRSGSVVDLNEEMRHLTLDVIGRSMFGLELGDDAAVLSAAIPGALGYVIRRALSPVRLPHALPTASRRRFDRDRAAIHAVINRAVKAHDGDPEASGADLIRLLQETEDPETGTSLSADALRDELFVFLIAGHDTTATTLTHALWQLGRHPDIQDAVRHEVDALGPRELTVADSRVLPLTVQVLHESLRLAPPAASLNRWAMRDCVVDGYRVRAGTCVIVSVYSLHRDPNLWDAPLEFRPERFAPEHARARDGWQYLPFGRGPRNCIGSHFAMLEATIGLATIIRSVDLSSVLDTFEVEAPSFSGNDTIRCRSSAVATRSTPARVSAEGSSRFVFTSSQGEQLGMAFSFTGSAGRSPRHPCLPERSRCGDRSTRRGRPVSTDAAVEEPGGRPLRAGVRPRADRSPHHLPIRQNRPCRAAHTWFSSSASSVKGG